MPRSTFSIAKYNGDDAYSWAVFQNGNVITGLTGCTRREAQFHRDVLRGQEQVKATAPAVVPQPQPRDFDGWVIIFQYGPDVLLPTDIERIDLDHQDAPLCETEHDVDRDAVYQFTSPEDSTAYCQGCVEDLHRNAPNRPDYVMGAMPAN